MLRCPIGPRFHPTAASILRLCLEIAFSIPVSNRDAKNLHIQPFQANSPFSVPRLPQFMNTAENLRFDQCRDHGQGQGNFCGDVSP